MKKIVLILSFFISFLFSEVYVKKNIRVVVGEGYGTTREDAVNSALVEAIGQLNGVKLKKVSNVIDNLVEIGDKSLTSFQYSSKINKITQGMVNSYKIEEVEQINDHKYRAVVSIKKIRTSYKYSSPGLNPRKRRSLAVIPFRYKKVYSFDNIDISGSSLTHRLTQAIVTKITQTRKFTVLDRENSEYYNLEKNFLLSGNTDPVELARLGKRLGADYFIIGEILDFGIEKNVENISLTGKNFMQINGYATVNYRILNIPTQQIKWSDTIDINFNIPKNKKRAESIIAISCDKIAQVLVEEIIFNIYPPRIIEDNGVSVILNMGGKFIHSGDIFEVYALGKKLYDPYTKEYLGRDEIYVGKIKITKVLPKISYAKIIEGRAGKGSIVRKIKKISNQKNKTQQVEGKDSMFDTMFK